jgi:putative aminopeptidase FrvX
MRPLADRVEVDAFGNVYGTVEGTAGTPRVMIPAHSDSVGMIVSQRYTHGPIEVCSLKDVAAAAELLAAALRAIGPTTHFDFIET